MAQDHDQDASAPPAQPLRLIIDFDGEAVSLQSNAEDNATIYAMLGLAFEAIMVGGLQRALEAGQGKILRPDGLTDQEARVARVASRMQG